MAILINRSMSGFRKWSEAQELKKLEKNTPTRAKAAVPRLQMSTRK